MAYEKADLVKGVRRYGAVPKTELLLSPQEYVALADKERAKFKEVRIVSPRLGESGFGKFLLIPKNPIYKVSLDS